MGDDDVAIDGKVGLSVYGTSGGDVWCVGEMW